MRTTAMRHSPALPPCLRWPVRAIRLTALALAAGAWILPGSAVGQEPDDMNSGFPILFAPYIGFHGRGPSRTIHEAVGIHLLYDLSPRLTLDGRAATEMGRDFGRRTTTSADLLWRYRSSEASLARAALGVVHWPETTAFTLGFRGGGGFSEAMEEEASSGGIIPPLLVWFEVRGGVARLASERGAFYRGIGIAEISMVLLMRKAE